MMTFRWKNTLCNKILKIMVTCAISLAATGCMTTPKNVEVVPPVPMTKKALVYNLSLDVPDGWGVPGAANEGLATNDVINKAIAAGKRVPLIDMFHPADNSDNMDARVTFFLVDSAKNFMPEEKSATMTDADFSAIAQNIISNQQEQAAKDKIENNIKAWRIYRDTIAGKLAIIQEGRGLKSSGEEMLVYYADIYLQKNKGLAIRAMCDAKAQENLAIIKKVVDSITYTPAQ